MCSVYDPSGVELLPLPFSSLATRLHVGAEKKREEGERNIFRHHLMETGYVGECRYSRVGVGESRRWYYYEDGERFPKRMLRVSQK